MEPGSTFACALLILCATSGVFAEGPQNATDRDEKLISLFQVVKFPNDPCIGNTGTHNGTCYTSDECKSNGGASAGSCAQGYGVCCIFSKTCGGVSNQNNTYFQSAGSETGSCSLKICPCNDNICQIRLDFQTFVISGPSTTTLSNGLKLGGGSVAQALSSATQCLTDQFTVTTPDGSNPGPICGTNTGEHMYIDASSMCNTLNFDLFGGTTVTRNWNIKITQYSCNYNNLAPEGCSKYHFGSSTGTIQSYNFNNGAGKQLADQNEVICMRRERGYCAICYTAAAKTDFSLSSKADTAMAKAKTCCGYGTAGVKLEYDCLIIPGALTNNPAIAANTLRKLSGFCGAGGLLTGTATAGAPDATAYKNTVCTKTLPFKVEYKTDGFEFMATETATAAALNVGFKLTYYQKTC